MIKEIEEYQEEIPKPTIEKLTELAHKQLEIETELEELAEKLKAKNIEFAYYAGGHGVDWLIPSLMQQIGVGVKSMTLDDGLEIKIAEELQVPSMARDSEWREVVVDFCDTVPQLSGMIKDNITIPFDKGSDKVKGLVEYLTKLGIGFERFRTINPQTLKAEFNKVLNLDYEDKENPIVLDFGKLNLKQFKISKIKVKKSGEKK